MVVVAVGKVVLVAATLVCLSSIGGAMMVACPVLLPLHWLAARRSGPYGTGAWALLAGLSVFQASWMWTFVAAGNAVAAFAVGAVASVAVAAAFLRRGADLAAYSASRMRPA